MKLLFTNCQESLFNLQQRRVHIRTKASLAAFAALITLTPAAVGAAEGELLQTAAISRDAGRGNTLTLPTALTNPKGSFTYDNKELLINALTYAPTDNLSVSTVLIAYAVAVASKFRFFHAGPLDISAYGLVGVVPFSNGLGIRHGALAGAVATLVLLEDSLAVSAQALAVVTSWGNEGRGSSEEHGALFGGSINWAPSQRIRLLAELLAPTDEIVMASAGLRLVFTRISLDLGAVVGLETYDQGETRYVIPVLGVSVQ